MANPRIEVEIGAVIDGLRKGIGESVKIIETLENQARDLEKALKEATDLDTIGRLNQDLAKTRNALSQLRTTGVEPLTKATSQYNAVGVDFARIIQDAPFGIIGVGNNITQLATSFQNLGEKGDSAGKKFKLALSSIFSAGNLVTLGISTLVTALTVLQQQGFFKTGDAAESLTDKLEKYREKLETIKRLSIEGQSNSQKEIQNFQLLRAQAENTNVSQEKRLQAVRNLQKTYPDYLGNLTQEQILTGNVGDAYNNLTKEIVATAKARAFSEQIAKNSLTTLSIISQEEERALKILQERDKLESIRASKEFATGQDLLALKQQENIQQQRINELIKEQTDSALERGKVEEENQKLIGKINSELSNGATFTKAQNDQKKESVKLEDELISRIEQANKLRDEALKGLSKLTAESFKQGQLSGDPLQNVSTSPLGGLILAAKQIQIEADRANKALKNIGKVELQFNEGSFEESVNKFDQAIIDANSRFVARLTEFNQNASDILTNGVVNTIGNFAFAIGDALGSGENVLKAAGGALLSGVASILDQLGQAAIAAGVGMIAIKKAFSNPFTAIAAGGALIALAGFIKAKVGKATGSIGGGGGSSIGTSGVGGGSGSAFAGGAVGGIFDQNREFNLVSVVRGNDIVLVSERAMDRVNKG
jgi:hypothetical protein